MLRDRSTPSADAVIGAPPSRFRPSARAPAPAAPAAPAALPPLVPIPVPNAFAPVRPILLPSASEAARDLQKAQARGASAEEIAFYARRAERAASRETTAEFRRQTGLDAPLAPPPPPLPGAPRPAADDGGRAPLPLPPLALPQPPAADAAARPISRGRELFVALLLLSPAIITIAVLNLPSKR